MRKEDKGRGGGGGREGGFHHTLDGDLRVICVYDDHGSNLCGAEERYGGEGVGKLVALAHGTEYRSARLFFVQVSYGDGKGRFAGFGCRFEYRARQHRLKDRQGATTTKHHNAA